MHPSNLNYLYSILKPLLTDSELVSIGFQIYVESEKNENVSENYMLIKRNNTENISDVLNGVPVTNTRYFSLYIYSNGSDYSINDMIVDKVKKILDNNNLTYDFSGVMYDNSNGVFMSELSGDYDYER